MTDQTLATYSNLSIYSAMAVLTLAMILYAVHLARLMPSKEREPKRELVPVGAEVGAVRLEGEHRQGRRRHRRRCRHCCWR